MPGTLFDTAVSATFVDDGSGGTVARAEVGPPTAFRGWHVTRLTSMTTNPSSVYTTLRVYKNFESPSSYLDGSFRADQDTSETNIVLNPADKLVCVWAKAPAGTIATLTVSGELL